MNQAFFHLPAQKQNAILQAGYQVFAEASYAQANMNDLAWKAGVSKSLLFYYFKNKQELYLYLWNEAARFTWEYMKKSNAYSQNSLFAMMERGMEVKTALIDSHRDMAQFALNAVLETDPNIQPAIQASYNSWFAHQAEEAISLTGTHNLKENMDPDQVLEQIRLASEGYLWRMSQSGRPDLDLLKSEQRRFMAIWKQLYTQENIQNPDTETGSCSPDSGEEPRQEEPS